METKRTWIYCRAAHNGSDVDVLAMQQRRLEIYAKEHGFEIVGSSSDIGNGLTLDHPGLLEFHAAAENGKLDILLTANLSRLGRDTDKVTKYYQMLRNLGVSVHTADLGEEDLSFYTTLLGTIDKVSNSSK